MWQGLMRLQSSASPECTRMIFKSLYFIQSFSDLLYFHVYWRVSSSPLLQEGIQLFNNARQLMAQDSGCTTCMPAAHRSQKKVSGFHGAEITSICETPTQGTKNQIGSSSGAIVPLKHFSPVPSIGFDVLCVLPKL